MSGFARRFDLDGIVLEVAGESAALASVVDRMFAGYPRAAAPPDRRSITVEIRSGSSGTEPPAGRPRFAFPPMRAYRQDAGWLLVDTLGSLHVTPGLGRVEGWLAPDADLLGCGRFATLTLWVAVLECLRALGRFVVHAAGLISPSGELMLVPGGSGCGKTSAALTLLEAGWSALTDDSLFLERAPDGNLRAFAYRRAFHLGPALLARRPRLRAHVSDPLIYEAQDKQWLDAHAAFPGQLVHHWGPPRRIVFPAISHQTPSRLMDLSPRQALLRLFEQSCFVFVDPSLASSHLGALNSLVNRAPAAQMYCAQDVFLNPAGYAALLEGTSCQSAALA